MNQEISVVALNKELSKLLSDPASVRALLATTFKGFDEKLMRQAILEGMLRGFTFKNFLEKDVYAIKYKDSYSLITSIDKARKIGAKSGVVGVKKPMYVMDGKKILSCEITVNKKTGNYVGDYTAEVFFSEFYKEGKNGYPSMWDSKPHVMISKVAEMHALRKACPEELSQIYTAEEFDKEIKDEEDYDNSEIDDNTIPTIHIGDDHGEPKPNLILDRASTKTTVPETETERRSLIIEELKRIDPTLDMREVKEVKRMVADLTELEFTATNYANIIHLLARK